MSLVVHFARVFTFVLGATLGVILAFWTLDLFSIYSNNYSTLYNPHSNLLTDSKHYDHWLQHLGFSRVPKVKNSCSKNLQLESDFLKQYVKITCVIFISNFKLAYSVYSSWVEKCDKFYFFGPKNNVFIPINTNTYSKYPWQRLCKTLEYLALYERKNLQWMILVDDNTYVIPENLRYSLALLNASEPFYGGQIKTHRNILFGSLSSGIILNLVALELLLQSNSLPCYLQNYFDADYFLGRQLFTHGIYPRTLLDRHGCQRFHSQSLKRTFAQHVHDGHNKNPDLGRSMNKDENGFCFSSTSITFKMPQDSLESFYDYLLYQFRKTPLCYLRDEYLFPATFSPKMWAKSITMYTNKTEAELIAMSDKEYYELWTNISAVLPQSL